MPDLLAHVLFCLIACELVNFKKKSLILIGAILPDIITKIILFGYIIDLPNWFNALIIFHSLAPLFFLVILIALFFKNFFSAAYLIGIGALSHVLLDILNTHYYFHCHGGYAESMAFGQTSIIGC